MKTDKEQCGVYIAACAGLVTLLAAMVEPYIPTIAEAIRCGTLTAVVGTGNACRQQMPI